MNIKFVLICLVISISISQDIPIDEGVLVLGEYNFKKALNDNQYLLVDFYAPWCGHCKKLAPEYAKAAKVLAKDNPPLKLGKIDVTIHKKIGIKYNIQSYPTIRLFIKGEPMDYTGGRSENDIVSWMRKKTASPTISLNSPNDVEKFKDGSKISIVYFGDDNEIINKIARSHEDIPFGKCNTKECYDNFKVKEGTLTIFKDFDEGRNDYNGEMIESAINSFLEINLRPLVMKFDEKCAQLIFANNYPALILFRSEKAENNVELDRMLKSVAEKFKGTIQIVTSDIKLFYELRLLDYIGIVSKDLPTLKIADTRSELKKYNFEGEMNEENIIRFVKDWESGKLKPFYRSQDIPQKQTEAVYNLVAKSFDDIVMDPTKDVLVEFYAPWCDHCKKLKPVYEELAKKYENNPNVIIAKMDATANEIENLPIQAFPTIKYWPSNNKNNPIDFNEEKNLESFIKFISVHGATPTIKHSDL